jgi:hypothetical protein
MRKREQDAMRAGPQSSILMDSVSDGLPGLAIDLQSDMGRMFRQLGVESFRASVIDTGSMAFHDVWTITDDGDFSQDRTDRPLDSCFPGAMGTITQLAQSAPDETVTQRLSPRHWVFGWRLDGVNVVLAEARYREARSTVSPVDASTVRLVCDIGMRARQPAQESQSSQAGPELSWPQAPAGRPPRLSLAIRVGLPLCVVSALLSAWLAGVAVPDQQRLALARQAEATRLYAVLDSTMTRGLASALATGDYGEVQTALSSFETMGYFKTAAVLNQQQRVVSATGQADGLRMGDPLPDGMLASGRVLDLRLGAERYGQLLLLRPASDATTAPAATTAGSGHTAPLLAWAAALASTLVALLLGRRWWRARASQSADAG